MTEQLKQLSFIGALSHNWYANDLKSIKGFIGLQVGVIKALFGHYRVNLASSQTRNIITGHGTSIFAKEVSRLGERTVVIQNPDESNTNSTNNRPFSIICLC